ncbi:cardiolipin synthase [Tenuibacillus multivorans]|uniref:Cardiolipin synthase n=1 Tax=Tenuibacillus multivorans TaxID=237069 RepID=A0A1H0EHX9_9BACI|nr:cardiolipin synthase [Tenuibacillus multivorans]GEL77151.1 cardiolipin synthase 2 [Tenuibacillus multivorans]SDN81920.1 cardiolipin synthase [Tenuibacillus multivorans]
MLKWIQVVIFLLIVTAVYYVAFSLWEGRIITMFSIFASVSAVLIGFMIFIENRNPSETLNWLLIFALFPVFGFFFYLFFGRDYKKKKRYKEKQVIDERAFNRVEGHYSIEDHELNQMGDHQRMLFRLAQHLGNTPVSFNTETKILTNGRETFPAIIDELNKAEHHIHMEYYIVRDDEIGNTIKDILIEKAQAGVEVRFLYDAVGSWQLSSKFKDELHKAGVHLKAFSPVKLPFIGNRINFRNHRKIIVIDGKIAFVGGLNIGDEYLGKNKYYGDWRDTHLYVRGEAVRSLQTIFLQDWNHETGEYLLKPDYLSPEILDDDFGGVQMITSGPDNQWETIKKLYFSMIISAKKSIWIASPYFIPDDDILTAMKVASLSGVDVRLLMPKRPDKRIVFHASRSYFPEMMDAGVKIYEYVDGFLHSKIVVVDHELASIGTSNMDMRSFHLNFEVNAFLFRTESTNKIVRDFKEDFLKSKEIDPEEFKNRSIFVRVMESLFRLLSPLL